MSSNYYNPYKKFVGSFIPNWLLCRKEISQGAKLCFARLAQYAGQNGMAFPSIEILAKELGVSRQQISTYLNQLEKYKLVKRVRRGLGKSNTYYFLEHGWFTIECKLLFTSDVNKSLHQNDNKSLHPIYEENHIRESYKNNRDADASAITKKVINKKLLKKKEIEESKKLITLAFEEVWAAYPLRCGTNSEEAALRCYQARIKEKEEPIKILIGVKNYSLYCTEKDIVNTEFVMQGRTFLGRDKHYRSFQKYEKKKTWFEENNEAWAKEKAAEEAAKARQAI